MKNFTNNKIHSVRYISLYISLKPLNHTNIIYFCKKEVLKKTSTAIVCLLINLFIASKFPVALNGGNFINIYE